MYPGVKNVILIKSNKNTVVVIKYYYTSHEKKVIYARDNIPKHSVLNLLTCLCERRLAILKLISYHLKNTRGSVTGEQHGILAKGKMGRRDFSFSSIFSSILPSMYLPHKQKHKRMIECLKFARDFCDIPGKEYHRKSQCMQNIII